jgi:hypothetical protein
MKREICLFLTVCGMLTQFSARAQNVCDIDYWFDNADYRQSLTGYDVADTVVIGFLQTTGSLNAGLHYLHYQIHHGNYYSSIVSNQFFKRPAVSNTNRMEYWFNDNFADRQTSPISDNTLKEFNFSTGGLSDGLNKLHYRLSNTGGGYSSVVTTEFFKRPAATINDNALMEYWFNDNFAARQTIPAADSVLLNVNLPVSQLALGLNTLYYRFLNNAGYYSPIVSTSFVKYPEQGTASLVEYWFDNNDGNKNYVSCNGNDIKTTFETENLPVGQHWLHTRVRTNTGRWSSVITMPFFKSDVNSAFVPDVLIVGYNYWFDNNINDLNTVNLSEPTALADLNVDLQSPFNDGIEHIVSMQFKDNRGIYSSIVEQAFTSSTQGSGVNNIFVSQMVIYPNPAKNELFIKSELPIKKVEVYSLTGSLMVSENNFNETINVSALPQGVYILKVYTGKGLVISKVVKK